MPTNLWNVWEQTARAQPDRPALVEAGDGQVYSRGELTTAARRFAASAPSALAAGRTVAFADRNGARWMTHFLALQALGAVALPLDATLPPAQQTEAAAALGAHFMLTGRGEWHALANDAPALSPDGDFCLLKTTSGSTGQPRTLAFTSTQMLADGRQIAATMGISPDDRNLGAIPFGHSYGLGNLVMPLVSQGTVLIASTEILPAALAAQIEAHAATVLPSVPTVLRVLAESGVEPGALRCLRRVVSAGASLRAEVAAGFQEKFGVPVCNFYGSSETGGICFDRTGEATAAGRSVGRPLDGVEVRLDDEGRVTVRGAAVHGAGEHTLADLGAWNDSGELVLTGRAIPLANIGGKKVAPSEIERALRALEGVTDVWVGVQSRAASGEDFLLAAVETQRPWTDVRRALAERLPAWQVPRQLWVTPSLPRTERGKLDRRELEAHCAALAVTPTGPAAANAERPPRPRRA